MAAPSSVRVVVVGTGRAAGALLASLEVAQIAARNISSRGSLAIDDVDIVLLAVSDDAIAHVAAHVVVEVDVIVAHVAGSRGRDVLPALVRRGVFHPLASLDGTRAVPEGTLCATDGDDDLIDATLQALAHRLLLTPCRVVDVDRARYHAGAVIAGNLATALLQLGVDELVRAGVPDELARVGLARLLASTAQRAIEQPLDRAVTGPVARGDVETVARHLAVLGDDVGAIYRRLSRVLVKRVRPAKAQGLDWSILDDK